MAKSASFLALLTCLATPVAAQDYEPVEFFAQGREIIAVGDIDGEALDIFLDVVEDNPQVDTLVLEWIGGSVDDAANLELSRAVRALGLATLVPADGLVASGGTDLFLAGRTRILEPGACVGVHSWAGDGIEGRDLPRDAREHAPYLHYYAEMGVAKDFYWFTLDAASAEDMHWMTATEAANFGLATQLQGSLGRAASCNRR
jgi:hypothetical protein